MPQYTVHHNQAVWETTTFQVDIPDGVDPVEYITENIDVLVGAARSNEDVEIVSGDLVESLDSDIDIVDVSGVVIYPRAASADQFR